jgi:hypothetical protein
MKLSSASSAFCLLFSAAAHAEHAAGSSHEILLSKARKLDQEGDEELGSAWDPQYAFLMNYQLKFVACKAGHETPDFETGEYEYNAVVFRLCPLDQCDDETSTGCMDSSGYGEYVVGLNTYVQAFFDDQRDYMYVDDQFQVDEYARCSMAPYEEAEGEANNGTHHPIYYIGPTCTPDGLDVRLELYSDDRCTQVAENMTFEELTNGWTLPYGDGGLVSNSCTACTDLTINAEEPRGMCMDVYQGSAKCETHMETYNLELGQQVDGCDDLLALGTLSCDFLMTHHAPASAKSQMYVQYSTNTA